ncbi:hypothetical protein HK101_009450 [Irineochytrium annulatum]|nr:hypothetical protein HK101_009450 [Irineochytrium annulatum]
MAVLKAVSSGSLERLQNLSLTSLTNLSRLKLQTSMSAMDMLDSNMSLNSTSSYTAAEYLQPEGQGFGEREKVLVSLDNFMSLPSSFGGVVDGGGVGGSANSLSGRQSLAAVGFGKADVLKIPFGITLSHESIVAALEERQKIAVAADYHHATETDPVDHAMDEFSSKHVKHAPSHKALQVNAMIAEFLNNLEENPELAPLFKEVIPWLPLEENDRTIPLGGEARKNLLRSLLLSCIKKLSEKIFLVLVFDDFQWFDSASVDLVLAIIKSCPKIYIQIHTQSIENQRDAPLVKVSQLPAALNISLTGLTIRETKELLVFNLQPHNVHSVHDDLLNSIYGLTHGNPLHLSLLTQTLHTSFPSHLAVSEVGLLMPTAEETPLPKTVPAAIFSLYDRLDPRFQRFLRAASIVGTAFDLDEVSRVMETRVMIPELRRWVEELDRFGFLTAVKSSRHHHHHGNKREICSYMFRHAVIQSSIYEMQSRARKEDGHSRMAEQYEETLAFENEGSVLPTLCYHVMRTSDDGKKVKYLERLAIHYLRRHLLKEGGLTMQTLLMLAETTDQRKSSLLEVASWWSWLAHAQALQRSSAMARISALRALLLLGTRWPTTAIDLATLARYERTRHAVLWTVTFGGQREAKGKRKGKEEVMLRVLRSMGELVAYDPGWTAAEFGFFAMLYVNQALECATLSSFYMNRTLQVLPLLKKSYFVYHQLAHICAKRGELGRSLQLAEFSVRYVA